MSPVLLLEWCRQLTPSVSSHSVKSVKACSSLIPVSPTQ